MNGKKREIVAHLTVIGDTRASVFTQPEEERAVLSLLISDSTTRENGGRRGHEREAK